MAAESESSVLRGALIENAKQCAFTGTHFQAFIVKQNQPKQATLISVHVASHVCPNPLRQ